MIIAFIGEMKSGKDFLCSHLVDFYGAKRLSFSDEVRRLAVTVFPWLPFDFDPAVKDEPFDHPSNPFGLTPREIWLLIGKVRDVDPKYFVKAFEQYNFHDIAQSIEGDELYIITDFRTPDEWEFLQRMGIPTIKIELNSRDGLPSSAFEDFVRRFKEYDARFVNHLNGTDEFDVFFRKFYAEHSLN